MGNQLESNHHPKPDLLERKIISIFEQLTSSENTRTDWTLEAKKAMANLGREMGCKIAAHSIGAEYGEWLYDLVWYREFKNTEDLEILLSVDLVMESEWNPQYDEILLDFTKLLQAYAPHRVLLCNQKDKAAAKKLFDFLQQNVDMYQNLPPDFRCLVVAYAGQDTCCRILIAKN